MADLKDHAGFTLIEAAASIGVAVILSGMMIPLGLRALNRHREKVTRKRLQAAFEAMFGCREKRVVNMRADFGYNPPLDRTGYFTLERLVTPTRPGRPPVIPWGTYPQATLGESGLKWGYNGPYWTGPVDGQNRPIDAWGQPIRCLLNNNNTVQLESLGPTAQPAERIHYPEYPVPISRFNCQVFVTVKRINPERFIQNEGVVIPFSGTIAIRHPNDVMNLREEAGEFATQFNIGHVWPGSVSTHFNNLMPGPMEIFVRPDRSRQFNQRQFIIDVLPGQSFELEVAL